MWLGVATVAIPVPNVGDSMGGPVQFRTCWRPGARRASDGAGVSSAAVREHITGEYLAQHRAGDSSGRLGEARNV